MILGTCRLPLIIGGLGFKLNFDSKISNYLIYISTDIHSFVKSSLTRLKDSRTLSLALGLYSILDLISSRPLRACFMFLMIFFAVSCSLSKIFWFFFSFLLGSAFSGSSKGMAWRDLLCFEGLKIYPSSTGFLASFSLESLDSFNIGKLNISFGASFIRLAFSSGTLIYSYDLASFDNGCSTSFSFSLCTFSFGSFSLFFYYTSSLFLGPAFFYVLISPRTMSWFSFLCDSSKCYSYSFASSKESFLFMVLLLLIMSLLKDYSSFWVGASGEAISYWLLGYCSFSSLTGVKAGEIGEFA